MKPDDEQLDALLRDVSVPEDLATRLKRIPNEIRPESKLAGDRWLTTQRLIGLAIAASLIGLMTWVAWPTGDRQQPEARLPEEPAVVSDNDVPGFPVAESVVSPSVDELTGRIEELTWQIELHEQRARLAELQRTVVAQPLDQNESRALLAFESENSALAWGADEGSLRPRMQKIIELYPNTQGARQARQFLASTVGEQPAIQ